MQATGNGHICRAKEILPELAKKHEVDCLLSGTQAQCKIEAQIRFRFHGASYVLGRNGGINYWQSWRQMKFFQLLKDVRALDMRPYDLVISDFEPVSAWAARQQGVPSIALSHQCALLSPNCPMKGNNNSLFRKFLRSYAPSDYRIGFHFDR